MKEVQNHIILIILTSLMIVLNWLLIDLIDDLLSIWFVFWIVFFLWRTCVLFSWTYFFWCRCKTFTTHLIFLTFLKFWNILNILLILLMDFSYLMDTVLINKPKIKIKIFAKNRKQFPSRCVNQLGSVWHIYQQIMYS